MRGLEERAQAHATAGEGAGEINATVGGRQGDHFFIFSAGQLLGPLKAGRRGIPFGDKAVPAAAAT
ncbi:hypothetical protein [Hymenobacter qilianensis]|uniref:hypothetical protein n=1 Tax=Hymenobacter qilianensis TaxID=1385715 RepID=UPI0016646B09|nr:hypothetical protein [Hymenobacter qilianensis]